MMDGRKPGTTGPIRKAIAKLLKRNGEMKMRNLASNSEQPPKGWQVCDNVRWGNTLKGRAAGTWHTRGFAMFARRNGGS